MLKPKSGSHSTCQNHNGTINAWMLKRCMKSVRSEMNGCCQKKCIKSNRSEADDGSRCRCLLVTSNSKLQLNYSECTLLPAGSCSRCCCPWRKNHDTRGKYSLSPVISQQRSNRPMTLCGIHQLRFYDNTGIQFTLCFRVKKNNPTTKKQQM